MSDTNSNSSALISEVGRNQPLVDLSAIDLSGCHFDRGAIAKYNPHRHEMALLDKVAWASADYTVGVATWKVRDDEFWVRGHFPGKPLLPGVLQVEAGAQLAVFLYNIREPHPRLCAFTRIDQCSFRGQVEPGDELVIICKEIKRRPRQFVSAIQGIVSGKVCYEAAIEGIRIAERW